MDVATGLSCSRAGHLHHGDLVDLAEGTADDGYLAHIAVS